MTNQAVENYFDRIKGKKIAVIGLGIEGIAITKFLLGKADKIAIFDKLSEQELRKNTDKEFAGKLNLILDDKNIKKILGEKYLSDINNYDIVFRSPGFYFNDEALIKAKKKGIVISSQIKLFFELCPCPIIGVTGTKGKGTTASLIYEILRERHQTPNTKHQTYLAGNIGIPAIDLIPKLTKYDIIILELSNFQLADLDKSPHIAVITNLGVDHLDYHQTIEEYYNAKFNILKHQGKEDFAILNEDSTFPQQLLNKIFSKKEFFSKTSKNADASVIVNSQNGNTVNFKNSDLIISEKDTKLIGVHNLENIAAAVLTSKLFGADSDAIFSAIKKFQSLPHRTETIENKLKRIFVDDSFATNPEPTKAAILSLDNFNKILILGGSSKNADFNSLAELIEQKKDKIRNIILIGNEGPVIKNSLALAGFDEKKIIDGKLTMTEIVEQAYGLSREGDLILFSPACASFDMFKNYKDRGDKFKKAVSDLSSKQKA